jgi:hypothetical protein
MINLRDVKPSAGRGSSATLRAGVRGLAAAMAMTGMRTVTSNAGLVDKTPPVAIVERHAPRVAGRLKQGHREALTELAHWGYGAAGGVVFGLLPAKLRTHPATGPVYGLAIWLGFETAIAPLLGVHEVRRGPVLGRVVVALDHLLYGVLVADRLAPEPKE